MRTTLTLDEDVAAKLQAEMRRSGRPFRQIVNDMLRRGFVAKRPAPRLEVTLPSFRMELRAGIDLDNIERLADELERRPGE